MIYLLRSYGKLGKSILKVGFSDQVDKRMSQYFSSNPYFELISVREGDQYLESLLHIWLRYLKLDVKVLGRLDEWFKDDPQVQQIFHLSRDSLERRLWKHRDYIFDLSGREDLNIFKSLYEKNKSTFEGSRFKLVEGKVIETGALKVDISFQKHLDNQRKKNNIQDNKSQCKSDEETLVKDFLDNHFYRTGIFSEKMKMYCEFRDRYGDRPEIIQILFFKIPDQRFRMFYEYYGTKGCSARKYQEKDLDLGWRNAAQGDRLKIEIMSRFKPGERYDLKTLKIMIQGMYDRLGIKKTAKAKDLSQFFKLSKTKVTLTDPNTNEKRVVEGFKITGVL